MPGWDGPDAEEETRRGWDRLIDQLDAQHLRQARERRAWLQSAAPEEARHVGGDRGRHHQPGGSRGDDDDAYADTADPRSLMAWLERNETPAYERGYSSAEQRSMTRNMSGDEALSALLRLGIGGISHEPDVSL